MSAWLMLLTLLKQYTIQLRNSWYSGLAQNLRRVWKGGVSTGASVIPMLRDTSKFPRLPQCWCWLILSLGPSTRQH
ncbi:hypothetical protein GGR57DRAFT_155273 [Xylariaceae sp. FL1272]|nr:hypothetical protein GGR57DRAFT_155273 [Xylariaceae sp. FL1272]